MLNIIERIDYFSCGSCSNHMNWMFKQAEKKKLSFPAGVFLIKHRTQGYILYDTGYSTELNQPKMKYRIYRGINPIQITREQMIDQQLLAKGIQPTEIRWIILSHLHPDHIGGVNQFPNAQFIMTKIAFQQFQKNNLKDLIFKELLPANFSDRVTVYSTDKPSKSFPYATISDIFGDGSLLLSTFNGHAAGQGCLFIQEKNIFIAADICWGIELIPQTKNLRLIPKLIQNDLSDYRKSLEILTQIKNEGIKVIVSHDPEERVNEVLI